MATFNKKRLGIVTGVYWFMLVYILAALVFWFLELEKQNRRMLEFRLNDLQQASPSYNTSKQRIENDARRKTTQYIAEGLTFLVVVVIGAVYVYRGVRRQFRMQQQQQNFMMAVTHELKTPIAVAQLNLETMQRHQLDQQKREKLIHKTLQETNRLNHLASNILVSSQLEGGDYQIAREPVDFSRLVGDCLHDFQHRFNEWSWKDNIEPGIMLQGDQLLLQIAVNNLLENAMKYSVTQTEIRCDLQRHPNQVQLSIGDEGQGIPEEEKKLVFRKFYRIGNEQTRTTKGTGLGLYLCKKIVTDHGGRIRIHDNHPRGSIFTISFDE